MWILRKLFINKRYFRVNASLYLGDMEVKIDTPYISNDGSFPSKKKLMDDIYLEFNPKGLMNRNFISIGDIRELPKEDFEDYYRTTK